jgi:homoserine O-acetyltransferase/O-succinyltransferase
LDIGQYCTITIEVVRGHLPPIAATLNNVLKRDAPGGLLYRPGLFVSRPDLYQRSIADATSAPRLHRHRHSVARNSFEEVVVSHTVASETELELPPYEVIGPRGAPVVVALGGISASRHVCANAADGRPGWWESIVGPSRAIDTSRHQVLSFDYLDGGRGSDGRPERVVTSHDQADALAAVLDEIGVARVQAIVGASYGGMVALAFAERYPQRVESLVVISAPDAPHPMSTAVRSVQRRIVELGLDNGCATDALSLARALAMTTYRSAAEFAERFDSRPSRCTENDAVFPVEEYLLHHGERFAAAWRPERFLALSLSGDLHRVEASSIRTPTLLVAAEGDAIVPRTQLEALAARIGASARLVDLPSTTGHDAFLTEPEALGAILSSALNVSIFS